MDHVLALALSLTAASSEEHVEDVSGVTTTHTASLLDPSLSVSVIQLALLGVRQHRVSVRHFLELKKTRSTSRRMRNIMDFVLDYFGSVFEMKPFFINSWSGC